jgi:hypothetical protein
LESSQGQQLQAKLPCEQGSFDHVTIGGRYISNGTDLAHLNQRKMMLIKQQFSILVIKIMLSPVRNWVLKISAHETQTAVPHSVHSNLVEFG